ncbi:MAG: hypothetical protein Q9165_000174 [Trypethelium subeluteriae]
MAIESASVKTRARDAGAAPVSPSNIVKIPSSSIRRPANIPLHTLRSSSRPYDSDAEHLLDSPDSDHHDRHNEKSSRRNSSHGSVGSEFSLWSDTGDLVDQLGDQEDPLQQKLRQSFEERRYGGSGGHQRRRSGHARRAHFQDSEELTEKTPPPQSGAIKKEDIEVPNPPRKPISRGEKLVAAIMAPNDGPSRMHGLHGKKLMFEVLSSLNRRGELPIGSFPATLLTRPRWLLDNDHDEEGIVVIANLYGKGDIHNPKARDEYREIKMGVLLQRQEGERSYRDMFKRYYKRVFIAMSAQSLAQLNGINVISYYAPLVFEQAGWVGRNAILMTGINGLTYLASTIPPWYLVDRWGRRPILLSGAVACIISLSLISYFIYIEIRATPTLVVIFVMIYNVWFIYPETANVRLEDMNALFGDATTAMPTPATLAEAESLFSRSPVPSIDLQRTRSGHGPDSAIPGLDINPPAVDIEDGKPMLGKDKDAESQKEGVGGWISNLVKRTREGGGENGEGGSGKGYKRVGQDDE